MTIDDDLKVAAAALSIIEAALEAWKGHKSGATTADQALTAMTNLGEKLAANNAEADKALADKFSGSTPK